MSTEVFLYIIEKNAPFKIGDTIQGITDRYKKTYKVLRFLPVESTLGPAIEFAAIRNDGTLGTRKFYWYANIDYFRKVA